MVLFQVLSTLCYVSCSQSGCTHARIDPLAYSLVVCHANPSSHVGGSASIPGDLSGDCRHFVPQSRGTEGFLQGHDHKMVDAPFLQTHNRKCTEEACAA